MADIEGDDDPLLAALARLPAHEPRQVDAARVRARSLRVLQQNDTAARGRRVWTPVVDTMAGVAGVAYLLCVIWAAIQLHAL